LPERKLKVFLSSTAKDLTAFRKAVHVRLAASPLFECIRQEDFGAQPHPPVDLCKAQVLDCDLFIGLIGMRRGWEPPDDNADHRSITEMEFDWAKDVAPRFLYVTPKEFPVPGDLRETEDEHQRQLGFRQRIMSELVVSQDGFASPEALAILIVDRLTDHVLGSDLIERIRPRPAPAAGPALHELPDAVAERVVRLLDERGDIKRAERGGLERDIVLKLAKRITPDDTLDFDRAVMELENAVNIALDAIARGRRASNEDDFVNDVLKNVATHTQAGETERAVKVLDDALKELDSREAEQRDTLKRSRLTLLQAGIKQDILRRDAKSAARRVEQSIAVEHSDDVTAHFEALLQKQNEWYAEGRDKGVKFSLEIAIEIARQAIEIAPGKNQRLRALNSLGVALGTQGERESGTERLVEAVAAFREALKDSARSSDPLKWARTQGNLGETLRRLGQRETGTTRLNEAVVAFREVLKEFTRKRMPLDWAKAQNNLGIALAALGMRASGTAHLDEAVLAFRAALKERTRKRAPLDWATTQSNLGNALGILGARESGTAKLEESLAAFRNALKERSRERVPLQWANSTGNEGTTMMLLAERRGDAAMAATAIHQIGQAIEVLRDGGHIAFAENFEGQLPNARAILNRLTKT